MTPAPVSTECWLRHIKQAQAFHAKHGDRHWRVCMLVDGYPFYWSGLASSDLQAVERATQSARDNADIPPAGIRCETCVEVTT